MKMEGTSIKNFGDGGRPQSQKELLRKNELNRYVDRFF